MCKPSSLPSLTHVLQILSFGNFLGGQNFGSKLIWSYFFRLILWIYQIIHTYYLNKSHEWFIKKVMWLKLHIHNLFNLHIMGWKKIILSQFKVNFFLLGCIMKFQWWIKNFGIHNKFNSLNRNFKYYFTICQFKAAKWLINFEIDP